MPFHRVIGVARVGGGGAVLSTMKLFFFFSLLY